MGTRYAEQVFNDDAASEADMAAEEALPVPEPEVETPTAESNTLAPVPRAAPPGAQAELDEDIPW
jgi:hypothetical protein